MIRGVILLISLCISIVHAQEKNYFEGQALVQFARYASSIDVIEKDLQFIDGQQTFLKISREVVPSMNIHLLEFDHTQIPHASMLRAISLHPDVLIAQNNHKITRRSTTPNDALFANQWQYINPGGSGGIPDADLDAELAWDITTGGLTPDGDTIVVCVIDDGIDLSHPDFEDNLWTNNQEIPNNGIDDDGNGYIDDYRGWNIADNSDDVTDGGFGGFHGTAVAGIIGAKGNNSIGVTGVNWDVKLMIVVGGAWGSSMAQQEASVLASYAYPLEMRKLYNETQGAKGAFVVATNSSWGVDFGQPASAPLWCAMYDSMGKHGILSAGATANVNVNVDTQGDLPTACSSDYLITVTNIWRNDSKVGSAGYGATTIDLGAFGESTYTADFTLFGSEYASFGGTSGATPHVAGTAGLLYSAPCESFIEYAKTYPDSAALKVKEFIINGADPNTSLQGITVSESRLNMNGAIQELLDFCVNCNAVDSVSVSLVTNNSAQLVYNTSNLANVISYTIRYRVLGSLLWTEANASSISSNFTMSGLLENTMYEVQVSTNCARGSNDFSESIFFTTLISGLSDYQVVELPVYPNPVTDHFLMSVPSQKDLKLSIYSSTGQLVKSMNLTTTASSSPIVVETDHWASGIYTLVGIDNDGGVYTQKVLKE